MTTTNATLGSRELVMLHRTMQLVTKLTKLADDAGVRLPKEEQDELIKGLEAIHRIVYG